MKLFNQIVFRLPSVRRIRKQNIELRKTCKLYFAMYQQECEKVSTYQDTLEEITSHIMKQNATNLECDGRNSKPCTGAKNEKNKSGIMEFKKVETYDEDETLIKAEEALERNIFGMAAAEYDGEPVKYQKLSEEMIEGLFKYCYDNPTKEVNLELGDSVNGQITGILESHTDNSLSVEIYEGNKHLQSFKTGKKEINEELISDYDESDIVKVLNSYGRGA